MSQNIKQNKRTEIRNSKILTPNDRSSRKNREFETIIGKYRFVRTLGKGNFAKVVLAKHIPTEYLVAIKVIDKTQLSKNSLEKLYREVRMLERIDHPNIVKLYEVIDRETTLYLIMEYLSGGEIFDYLVARGRMKEKDARAKFRQIVSAVQYCHQKFIVHRDLKAENLLLDENFNVKLADFGFSNEYCPGKKLDTFCGSPPYAAPELFRGEKYTGPEVDVWSLGVILFTLITGSLPFDGQNLKEVREKVLSGRFRIPFFMSNECENLVKKLLSQNPLKRPFLETVMKDKWINCGFEDNKLIPFVEPPEQNLEEEFVDKIVKMGYEKSQVLESLEIRAFDEISATYYFLLAIKKSALPPPDKSKRFSTVSTSARMIRPASNSTKSNDSNKITPRMKSFITKKPEVCPQIRSSPTSKPFNGGYVRTSIYYPKRPEEEPQSHSINQSFRAPNKKIPAPSIPSSTSLFRKSTLTNPVKANETKSVRASFIDRLKGSRKPSDLKDQIKPRALKFTWSLKNSSTGSPDHILAELIRALKECDIDFEHLNKYLLMCVSGSFSDSEKFSQFEAEVCHLPRSGMHGVKFKRVTGSNITFKNLAQLLTRTIKL